MCKTSQVQACIKFIEEQLVTNRNKRSALPTICYIYRTKITHDRNSRFGINRGTIAYLGCKFFLWLMKNCVTMRRNKIRFYFISLNKRSHTCSNVVTIQYMGLGKFLGCTGLYIF